MVKAMRAGGPDWGTGCRQVAREAPAGIIRDRMAEDVDRWLDSPECRNGRDRRNGTCRRRLLCEPGDIGPGCRGSAATAPPPCWRTTRAAPARSTVSSLPASCSARPPAELVRSCCRCSGDRSHPLPSAAWPGLWTPPSPPHRMLDGVVLARKTGAGAVRRPVLVALGILPDGRKEIIDLQSARAESAAEWERLPASLHRRGLTGEGLEVICADSGNGLPVALPPVHPDIPVRRCRVHKIQNILNKVRKPDHDGVKRHLHDIMNASNLTAARRFADRRRDAHPKAVECLCDDPNDLPARFRYSTPNGHRQVRTTNTIERRFREVGRRTRPMSTFRGCTSMERVLFAILSCRNKNDRIAAPFSVTDDS